MSPGNDDRRRTMLIVPVGTMEVMTRSGPRRWCVAAAVGLYRCAVLTGLTAAIPVLGAAVAFFGTEFALSWPAQLSAPLAVRVLGRLEIDSPAGGPTRITVAVPCALS
jgi:hypothetical protein